MHWPLPASSLSGVMIIFGIHSLRQLRRFDSKSFFDLRRDIALDLYPLCASLEASEAIELQELILRNFSCGNSAYKRTQAGRFQDFDGSIANVLKDCFESYGDVIRIHDLAVSDGRTSVDFYEVLRSNLPNQLDFLGSDLDLEFHVLNFGRSGRAIYDCRGTCLQLVIPPFVHARRSEPRSRLLFLDRFFGKLLSSSLVPSLDELLRRRNERVSKIRLLSPRAAELESRSPNVRFEQADLLERPRGLGTFHIVRAMNVLNRSYFREEFLRHAVCNVFLALKENGVFVTGSNQDAGSEVEGGVYRRRGDRFVPEYEANGGSPVREILLEFSGSRPTEDEESLCMPRQRS